METLIKLKVATIDKIPIIYRSLFTNLIVVAKKSKIYTYIIILHITVMLTRIKLSTYFKFYWFHVSFCWHFAFSYVIFEITNNIVMH